MPQVFHHSIDVYLKDSNAYGNTYFARYFEWQGICRERWFHQCIDSSMLIGSGVLITKSAHQDYVREVFPFQRVDCRLYTMNVKQCSLSLRFEFFVAGELVSTGQQEIVFADHNKKITRFPKEIIARMKEYSEAELAGNKAVESVTVPDTV